MIDLNLKLFSLKQLKTTLKKSILFTTVFLIFKAEAQTSAYTVADSLYTLGNYAQAINTYAGVGSTESEIQIARAYNSMGNFDKAIAQYEGVVAKNADIKIAQFELGKLYLKINRPKESAEMFFDLIRDASENPEYHYYRGLALNELENFKESISAFKDAVKLDSTHLRSLFQLGKYYVAQREKDSTLKYVDKGLRFYENDVSLINLKALAYYNNDQFGKSAPWFERLLELGEKKEYIYYKLANCQYHIWEFDKAKTNYHILLDIDDGNPDYYFNMGHVFFKDRQLDSASYYINRSIAVQQVNLGREYESLARISRVQENIGESLKFYKLAHKEAPDNLMIYYQVCALSDTYLKDPNVKLEYYEGFIKKFGTEQRYYSEMVAKRIKELKQEVHFEVK